MSATVTFPQWRRPGRSRCPGLRRKNVMVSAACTAAPSTWPLSPEIPLGRSTARIGRPDVFMASTRARAAPSIGRVSPAPNSASMMRSAIAEASGVRRHGGTRPALGRFSGVADEPRRVAQQQHPHAVAPLGQEARRHEPVAAVVARPRDDRHARRPPAKRAAAASATACPARSISTMPGVPASIVSRSASAISRAVRSSIMRGVLPGEPSTEDLPRKCRGMSHSIPNKVQLLD